MKKQSPTQLQKKFEKLLKLCQENEKGLSSIMLHSDKIIAYGLGPDPIKPPTVIYYSIIEGLCELKGKVNNTPISSAKDLPTTYLALDNRSLSKPVLYISAKNQIKKINHKSILNVDEKVLLYWEYGPYSCFIFSAHDITTSATFVEAVFSENAATQKANRYLLLNLLPSEERESISELLKTVHNDVLLIKDRAEDHHE